jgi:hypothetical protein
MGKKDKTNQAYIGSGEKNNQSGQAASNSNDPYQKYKDFKWEDPDQFKNGPVGDDSRKCRDCICCIIFLVLLALMIFIGILGFKKGQPTALLYAYDEEGNACGHKEGYEDYKYLYFYSVLSGVTSFNEDKIIQGVCVSKCPSDKIKKTATPNQEYHLQCKATKNNPNCVVKYKDYYESKPILGRLCFPASTEEELKYDPATEDTVEIYDPKTGETFTKVVEKNLIITSSPGDSRKYIAIDAIDGKGDPQEASAKLINLSFFSQKFASMISDLNVTKYAIAGSVGWSFIIALVFLLFLRLCAGVVTFLFIFTVQVGLIILAVFFKYTLDHAEQEEESFKVTMEVLFYIFTALAIIWFIFIMVMCNRIRLAVALVKITSKYIHKNCCIILAPFFFFILIVVWIAYWLVMLVFLYSSGEFDKEKSKIIASFQMDDRLVYCFWFHVFTLFYITAVLLAYSQFVYASSACIWYFTSEKGTEGHLIAKSFYRGLRYHFGSLCFGASIIAIVRFIMFFLEYIKKKVEAAMPKNQAKIVKCLISCMQCCLGCCAKVMEFINKHAYIQIALKGDSFCIAAWQGFALIIRNMGRFGVLALIGGVLSVIGTICIAVSSAVVGYFVITKLDYFSADLNSCILPVIVFGLIGFIVGKVTMSIFSVSGDALIHAFLLDEELNKGQPKAFPELQKFMNDEA